MEIQNCKYCNLINEEQPKLDLFSEEEINHFLRGVYDGRITITNLDEATYKKIGETLTKGVYEGFGKTIGETVFGEPDHVMLKSLRENVYVFSAAKSYQQTKEMSALLTNEKGLVPFREFKQEAKKVFEIHNEHYLKAEYNSAIAQSRAASAWMDIEKQKDVYGQLQYQTVGDARVRYEHQVLDEIIRPVGDKFWNIYYPPNGWNCRCLAIQVDDEPDTDLSTKTPPTQKEVPDLFRFNAGKEKIIFNKAHPYFQVPAVDKPKALRNFDLPLPKVKKPVVTKEGFIPAKTIAEAEERIRATGVKEVLLKGLKPELANAVLEIVEKEASYGDFKLESLITYRRSKSDALGIYSPSNKKIGLNLSHVGKEHTAQVVLPFEEQLELLKKKIKDYGMEYLGNAKYRQQTVVSNLNVFKNRIHTLEAKIAAGETPKAWTIASTTKDKVEMLKAVVQHELGHLRHYTTLKLTTDFRYLPSNSITDYGKTNFKEYFAEWFTHYRMKGEAGVPDDMIKLFKQIDNAKQ